MSTPGILAIWNDCAVGREVEYEHWYRTEHLAERVGIPGFESGWRYVAVDAEPTYFTHYVTESPAVLFSAAYRARLDNPTALTQRVMSSGVFVNASRTECERVLRVGEARGAFAAVVRYAGSVDPGALGEAVRAVAARDEVLRGEVWRAVVPPARAPSREQSLRAPDATISACVLIEATDERAAREALARAALPRSPRGRSGVYRLICGLLAADLASG